MTLPQQIVALRKAKGWSQERLADAVGTTRKTVITWEKQGATPSPPSRKRLVELGVPAGAFATEQTRTRTEERLERLERRLGLTEALVRQSTRDATIEIEHLRHRIELLEQRDTGSGTNQGDRP